MTEERWRAIEDLFERAQAAPVDERAALLERACAGDDELFREVSTLLANAANGGASIRRAVAAEAGSYHASRRAAAVGRRFGAYRLTSLIGEGGMGAVY